MTAALQETAAEPRALRAGPLTLLFEEGGIRYVRWGNVEVLRRVYGAVRDRNWDTIPAQLSRVRVEQGAGSFLVTFQADCRRGEIDFTWGGTIRGTVNGTITFAFEGEARSSFLRNRIGLCVLHPVRECAGRPCTVEHADGSKAGGAFPGFISPHQPFMNLRAISHEVASGLSAEVRFEGDVFEMEDQRNWTDASFKTYSTPLSVPFPVEVPAGTRISQKVVLRLAGNAASPAPAPGLSFSVGDRARPLPRIGLLGDARGRRVDHVRIDVRAGSVPDLRSAGPVELAVHLTDRGAEELEAIRRAAGDVPIARLLVFHDREKSTARKWLVAARTLFAGVPVAGGTDAYFAELNRNRPPLDTCDAVAWSVNPQVHAFDDATLVENLEAQAWTIESARAFCGGKPLCVTPVTLRPRFNPNATGPEAEIGPDPRQGTPFGDAWTLVSLKYLAEAGVDSVTFAALPDAVDPFVGGEIVPSRSSDPRVVDGLVLRKDGRTATFLVNWTAAPQRVEGFGELAPRELRRIDA